MFLPLTFSLFYFVSIFLEAPIAAEDEPKAYKGPSFDAWGIDVPAELLSNPKVAKEVQDLIDLYGDMYNDLQDAIATHSEGDITA